MESSEFSIFASYRFWAAEAVAGSYVLTRYVPAYSVQQSFLLTAAVIYSTHWFLYGVYSIFLWPRFFSPLRHLPTVTDGNDFVIGQWRTVIKEPSGYPMRRWMETIPNNGLLRYFHLWNRERILITNPKALSEVMVTKSYDFIKPTILRASVGAILGIGILMAEGDDHKAQRKGFSPAFHFRHIKDLYPVFWAKSRELVRCIEDEGFKKSPKGSIEITEWTSRATLDIIGVAGMGQDFNALVDPNTELNNTYRAVFRPTRAAQIAGLMRFFIPDWVFRSIPLKSNSQFHKATKLARDTSKELVRRKKERLAKGEKLSPDIISIALESGYFTDDSLVDNMMTFLAAGHETTASAMAWAVYLLCKHPDAQKRLRDEVRARISSIDSEIDSTMIDGLPYLHAVVQETLRLFPPVPVVIRDACVDTTIAGQHVPKGSRIILSPWAVNLNTELWGPDAGEFRPERWMTAGRGEGSNAHNNYAFMTFLHGPRGCIGQRFANSEMLCLLAAFVGRFEFEMTDPEHIVEPGGALTAAPKGGLMVNVKSLEGW